MPLFHSCTALATLCLAASASAQSRLYVDTTAVPGGNGLAWSTAMDDLQDALDSAAAPGSSIREIWVARGTYRPDRGTTNRSASFVMRSGLRVLGGFAGSETSLAQRNAFTNPTILSGDLGAGARAYHVVLALGVDSAALLDGFEITGGAADGAGAASAGGGVRCEESSLQISNCWFRGNAAQDGGAGFFLACNATILNCRISGNFASRDVGGMLFWSDFGTNRSPRVINSTFTGNQAVNKVIATALGAVSYEGALMVRNCIVWNNTFTTPTYFPAQMWGRLDGNHCCVNQSSAWPNPWSPPSPVAIYADPRMVSPSGPDGVPGTPDDDLRIRLGSSCVDTGDPAAIPPDTFDLDDDGNTSEPTPLDAAFGDRIYDEPGTANGPAGAVDIGAFEGPALAPLAPTAPLHVPEGGNVQIAVRLTRPPASQVTVTLGLSGDPDLSVTPSLLFDPATWDQPQQAQVAAAEDADSFEGAGTVTLSIGPGHPSAVIPAFEVENDQPPGLIYVDRDATGTGTGGTWANAFTSLSAALAYAASSGGAVTEVWVAAGTYTPSGPWFSLLSGVALYGGFQGGETSISQRDWIAHPTILSGDTLGNDGPGFANYSDNKVHVIFAQNVGPTARLDGFVVSGGYAFNQSLNHGSSGAGLYAERSQLAIANCVFSANLARIRGGGANVEYESQGGPAFTDCRFTGNAADEGSGSNGQGGGLFAAEGVTQGGALTFQRCVFEQNTARSEGGGAWLAGRNLTLTGCEFRANSIVLEGTRGAGMHLRVDTGGTAALAGCSFVDHIAPARRGAGAFISGVGTAAFTSCTFSGNSGLSGALSGEGSGSPPLVINLSGCSFGQNHATAGEAAFSLDSGNIESSVVGCTFSFNSTPGSSGAGVLRGLIRDCVFSDNTAATGGAVSIGHSSHLVNCTFLRNTATAAWNGSSQLTGGGAALASSGNVTFTGCTFQGNRTTGADAMGGAVLASQGVRFLNCTFVGNAAAGRGGAVFAVGSPVWGYASRFAGNSAAEGGGYCGSGTLANCSFTACSAAQSGGAISALNTLAVRNCSLAHCAAPVGPGVFVARYGTLDLHNSALWDAVSPPTQPEIARYNTGETNASAAYSRIRNWSGSPAGPGNSAQNPLFADGPGPDLVWGTADDTLALAPGSPCIDAAANPAAPPDHFDLNQNGNVSEPVPFDLLGNPRFVDDATPDTGIGTPPIIDAGAHEFDEPERLFSCYPNCDGSTQPPILNVQDFSCFLTRYAAGESYANCDGSTQPPVLNVQDFSCFLTAYAAGCR